LENLVLIGSMIKDMSYYIEMGNSRGRIMIQSWSVATLWCHSHHCQMTHVHVRGCTLGKNFKLSKGGQSAILVVWAAPGASEAISLGGEASPPSFVKGFRDPRGRPDP